MAIKTYEEVMGKTSPQKSGIITYESLFGKKEEPAEATKPPAKQGLFSTPSNLSPERQAAYDRGFFPKPINNLLANLTQRYEDSKLGKFQARSSETALDVMSGQEINPDRTSTGSKVGDTAATVLGSHWRLRDEPEQRCQYWQRINQGGTACRICRAETAHKGTGGTA
ncbi:MAG: hypothetical protein ACOX2X_04675 [Peptococcia bacterium]